MLAVKADMLKKWIARLDNNNAQKEYYLTDIVGFAVVDGVAINTANPDEICEIEGRVELGDGVTVASNVVLKNVSIGANTQIHANSVLEESVIGAQCDIGPFARLRPQTNLANNVKVGNFVEIKKSNIAENSKINHLSYVGDTTMGTNVNVGAGTITCNYDGANKCQTVIGDNVFIGSDTQLIAPVVVADGATIGAGSTITRDTLADTLTLSRVKQVSVKGWKRPRKTTES